MSSKQSDLTHPAIQNHGQWHVEVPAIFFQCTHGVFPGLQNGSLCYATSEERANLIRDWLIEGHALRISLEQSQSALAQSKWEAQSWKDAYDRLLSQLSI